MIYSSYVSKIDLSEITQVEPWLIRYPVDRRITQELKRILKRNYMAVFVKEPILSNFEIASIARGGSRCCVCGKELYGVGIQRCRRHHLEYLHKLNRKEDK